MRAFNPISILIALAVPLFGQGAPNHLEPWTLEVLNGGLGRATQTLLPEGSVSLWMIGAPAFEPDFSVCIIRSSSDPSNTKFLVRYHRGSKNIFLPPPPLPPPPPGSKPNQGKRPQFKPLTKSVPLDAKSALAITKVWERALQRTRYTKDGYFHMGADGCIYVFGIGGFIGATWSPSGEIPAKLVELSTAMVELATSSQNHPPQPPTNILAICAELSAALDSEGPARWP